MKTFLLFLMVGIIGTYIDVIIDWINWPLVIVSGIAIAVLSPFIAERLREINKLK
jgi:membrane associated rhomboid family serine protease